MIAAVLITGWLLANVAAIALAVWWSRDKPATRCAACTGCAMPMRCGDNQ